VEALHADQRRLLHARRVVAALIRHADPERDAAPCAAIYAPFVANTAISLEEQSPTAAEFAQRIETISARFPWLIAEEDGSVVGYAYASTHNKRAAYRWAVDVAVYVAEGRQRRGVGRALYDALFSLLVRQGIHVACAGIGLPNAASVALHEACGFQPVGVYRRIGWKIGRWHDVGWWELELQPVGPEPPAELGPPVRLQAAP
jgi:phosphinothricin acetyltransferase